MENFVFNVESISCEHCVNRITKALQSVEGVGSVSVDLSSKTVSVQFDPANISLPSIRETIEESGYEVQN